MVLTLEGRCQIFGPVLALGRFSTEEEAIELANNTSYGLGAGLHSSGSRVPSQQCCRRKLLMCTFYFFSGREPMYARFIGIGVWYCE